MPPLAARYVLRRRLGPPGAQGEVYEALDTYENDVVALKLLTSWTVSGPWAEAQILRRLADPHILPIRNADHIAGRPFLATELAHHGTLQDRLVAVGQRGLDLDELVRWIRQACFGIARAHDWRLLHNDLKPGNLFLNAKEECLVGDFGCATLIPAGATTVRPHGATAETAAPEIAASWGTPAGSASILSDVYSLGATAFWLLTARPPHDLTGATDIATKMSIVATQPAASLRDLAPHVPKPVAAAIETAISRSPGDRYRTVTDFAAALGARPTTARRWQRTDEHPGPLSGVLARRAKGRRKHVRAVP